MSPQAYWVSCPRSTGLVQVRDGRVIDAAPVLRRTWVGHPWYVCVAAARRQWGTALVVVRLADAADGAGAG